MISSLFEFNEAVVSFGAKNIFLNNILKNIEKTRRNTDIF